MAVEKFAGVRRKQVSALARLLAAARGDLDLVELHGEKAKPGYSLLHSPDVPTARAANRIYALYGQDVITQPRVDLVKAGVRPQAAVPAGTPVKAHRVPPGHGGASSTQVGRPAAQVPGGPAPTSDQNTPQSLVSVYAEAGSLLYSLDRDGLAGWTNKDTRARLDELAVILRHPPQHTASATVGLQGRADHAEATADVMSFLIRNHVGTQTDIDKIAADVRAADAGVRALLARAAITPSFQTAYNRPRAAAMKRVAAARIQVLSFDPVTAKRGVREDYVKNTMGLSDTNAMPKDDMNRAIEAYLLRDLDPQQWAKVKDEVEAKAAASAAATKAKIAATAASKRAARQAASVTTTATPAAAPSAAAPSAAAPSTPSPQAARTLGPGGTILQGTYTGPGHTLVYSGGPTAFLRTPGTAFVGGSGATSAPIQVSHGYAQNILANSLWVSFTPAHGGGAAPTTAAATPARAATPAPAPPTAPAAPASAPAAPTPPPAPTPAPAATPAPVGRRYSPQAAGTAGPNGTPLPGTYLATNGAKIVVDPSGSAIYTSSKGKAASYRRTSATVQSRMWVSFAPHGGTPGGRVPAATPAATPAAATPASAVPPPPPPPSVPTPTTTSGTAHVAPVSTAPNAPSAPATSRPAAVSPHVAQPSTQPVPPGLDPPDPVIHTTSKNLSFDYVAGQKSLPGWAEKFLVIDQFGNEWLAKPEGTMRAGSTNVGYRTDLEHAAHVVGNAFGFNTSESRLTTVKDASGRERRVQVQRMFEGVVGDFTSGGNNHKSRPVSSLTARQMQDVVDEHLLDWALANHDTHTENLLELANGTIVGIDKGQAFKYMGNDKLQIGYRPFHAQTKPNPVEDIYKAIVAGDLDKAAADELVRNALQRAARMELADEEPMKAALLDAMKKRPKDGYADSKGKNPQAVVDDFLARKRSLARDFEKFYRDVYSQAGLAFDDDLLPQTRKELEAGKVEGVYSGLSDGLIKDAMRSGSHGVSTMVAGTDAEDGAVLFWTEKWGGPSQRKTFTAAELNAYEPGTVVAYPSPYGGSFALFTKQSDGDWTNTQGRKFTAATVVAQGTLIGPTPGPTKDVLRAQLTVRAEADRRVTAWLEQRVGASATPPSAALGPITDASDLLGEASTWPQLVEIAKNYSHHAATGTHNARRVAQLASLRQSLEALRAEKANGTMTAPMKANIDRDPDSWDEMIDTYLGYVKVLEDARTNGVKPPVLDRYVYSPKAVPTPTATPSPAPMQIKVEKISNGRQAGHLDRVSGTLVVGAPDISHVDSGDMFKITVDADTEIEYRPWNSRVASGVAVSQQGVLRIVHKNPSGKHADMDRAFEVLREMGLDLKPAEADDLELLYWRQIYGEATQTRSDRHAFSSVTTHVTRDLKSSMSAAQQIAVYKDAFATVWKREDIDNADWRPQFSHNRMQTPDLATGRPYFFRPDVQAKDMSTKLTASPPYPGYYSRRRTSGPAIPHFPTHSVGLPPGLTPLGLVQGGVVSSIEERIRANGLHLDTGRSYGNQSSGGGNYVYAQAKTHLRAVTFAGGAGTTMLLLSPDVVRRTSTWDLASMSGGAISLRSSSSHWNLGSWRGGNGSAIHLKHSISFLTDVEVMGVQTSTERDDILNYLRGIGVTEIRGLPIEDRIVLSDPDTMLAAQEKAWAKYNERAGKAPTTARRPRAAATAAAGLGGVTPPTLYRPSDVPTYIDALVAANATPSAKDFLGVTRKVLRLWSPVTGAKGKRFAKVFSRTPDASNDRNIYLGNVRPFPLQPDDKVDLKKIQAYIQDLPSLATAPKPVLVYDERNDKYYIKSGLEEYLALRMTGRYYMNVTVETYRLSDAENADLK